MLLIAIFVVSLSTLAFEVLLTRVFAIGQWNHLSFMVLSIALFGFGASGTFLSLFGASSVRPRWSHLSGDTISFLLLLFSISAILSYISLIHIPLDYFRLPVEPLQGIYLLAAYLGLSLPFFVSGLIIAMGYTSDPDRAGLVYFASMAGSAAGAIVPVVLLPLIDEGRLIIFSATVPLIPATAAAMKKPTEVDVQNTNRQLWRKLLVIGTLTAMGTIFYLLATSDPAMFRAMPSPYKALGQILQFPKTRVIESRSSIRGRVDRVKTPYVRFAPGLSLNYTMGLPRQEVVYVDGDHPLVLYRLDDTESSHFATHMQSFAAYDLIQQPEDVLLIQQGGGSAVPCALASGAGSITLIEQNKFVAGILQQNYPGLEVVKRNPRTFLAQSKDRYDIIHIENWGASIPGAAALDQDHTITEEAFHEYWNHLKPGGIISISRKLLLPPSDTLRLWGTAYAVSTSSGVSDPAKHIALIRNFDTYTLLISKSPIRAQGVIDFSKKRNFDLVFLENMDGTDANRYHVFERPIYYREINRLAAARKAGLQDSFFKDYLLDIQPRSDRRPFPGRHMKWFRANELYESLGSRFYVLFLSGEVVVSLVFIEALILAVFLLMLPVVLVTRKSKKPTLSRAAYFLGIGAGFMFVELYLIKFCTLIFGHPITSFTTVVAAVLISSSLGGLYIHSRSVQNVRPALFILIGVLILAFTGLELTTGFLLNLTTIWRYFFVLLIILPVGILMGLPFPLAMQSLLDHPSQRAYAWAVNGCAAVLSSIAAAQLAISVGIPAIAFFAIASYLVAVGAARKMADG
jgi:hypothetical protein